MEIDAQQALTWGTAETAKLFVVVLHGYGMQPEDLAPFARSLGVPAMFHFPRAPGRVDTGGHCWWARLPMGLGGAAPPWDLSAEHPVGRETMRAALGRYLAGLEPLRQGRPLLLVGFSQGGMLACDYVLHESHAVTSLALLSSSRIAADEWGPRLPRLQGMRCLVSHGHTDAELSFGAGERLRDSLVDGGASVDWVAFDGGHEIPLVVWRRLRHLMMALA